MTIEYQDPSILDDANNLLIHHVKRQTSIHKEDKQKIKLLLRHFLMDTFKHPRQDLSEDEREDEEDSSNKEDNESDTGNNLTGNMANNGNNSNMNSNSSISVSGSANRDLGNNTKATRSERVRKKKEEKREKDKQSEEKTKKDKDEKPSKEDCSETDIKLEHRDGRKTPLHARDMEPVSIIEISMNSLAEFYTTCVRNNKMIPISTLSRMSHICTWFAIIIGTCSFDYIISFVNA